MHRRWNCNPRAGHPVFALYGGVGIQLGPAAVFHSNLKVWLVYQQKVSVGVITTEFIKKKSKVTKCYCKWDVILWIPVWRHFTVFCLFSSASLEAGGCPEIGKHPLSSPLCWQISIQTDTTAPASLSTRPRSTCRYSTVSTFDQNVDYMNSSAVSFQLREFLLYSLLSLNPPPFTDPHKHVICKVEWTRTCWRQYSILLELQQKPSNKHYVPLSKREKS